jgi:hypothetical protein
MLTTSELKFLRRLSRLDKQHLDCTEAEFKLLIELYERLFTHG